MIQVGKEETRKMSNISTTRDFAYANQKTT